MVGHGECTQNTQSFCLSPKTWKLPKNLQNLSSLLCNNFSVTHLGWIGEMQMAMTRTSIHSATIPLHSTSTNTSLVCNNSCAPPPLAKLHVGGAAAAAGGGGGGGGGGKGGDFFLCNNLCGHTYGNCCALVIKPRKRNRTPAVAPLAAIATSADAPTTDNSANLLQLKTELLVSCSSFSIFQIYY